ncbi:hypothetical protein [Zobellella aerophila]|uniref:Uncharacterized protein n=1 Tax=Zobellella aerophila TaxID=870480 RepID=A0ABP6VAE3_9GAMM
MKTVRNNPLVAGTSSANTRSAARRRRIGPFMLTIAALATDGMAGELELAYGRAVVDAAFVEEAEISTELVPVTRDNPALVWNADQSRILVATWKAQGAYEQFFKPYDKTSENPEYAVWVTTAPQVKQLCADLLARRPDTSKEGVELRLKQYLGLDPSWQYDVFVEMWVDPADLFRPCVNPQVDGKGCQLHFGEQVPEVKNIADYRNFYENLYYKSFRGSAGVPWTGLGYTYDWGNPNSEVGASEYILVPGVAYEIKEVTPTMEYCRR